MSDKKNKLIALVFDDPYKADEARAALNRMGGEGLLEIDETAVIVKNAEGKLRISQDVNVVEKDQHQGPYRWPYYCGRHWHDAVHPRWHYRRKIDRETQ